jgi:hypothetical protein
VRIVENPSSSSLPSSRVDDKFFAKEVSGKS